MREFNWSHPQRQPIAGLVVVFLNTIWEVAKRLWPLLILMVIGKKGNVSRYEYMAIGFLVITIVTALLRFLYFRFYLEENKLIIRKGWIHKETQVIPLEKIQTVNIEQGPLHQLLRIVKLSIDTAGTQNAEATIDSLHQSMAIALRERLLSESQKVEATESKAGSGEVILKLNGADLGRLSISANHLEAFFILLSFGFGLYENLKDIDNSLLSGLDAYLPEGAFFPLLFLAITILIITVLVSTARIFFRFYNFRLLRTDKGYQIKSGLTLIKEKLIGLDKIQFLSWKANWIRKLMGMWMLEYHVAGGEELKNNLKVQVPVTRNSYLHTLVNNYQAIPTIEDAITIGMHRAFVQRRLLILGLLPSIILAAIFWWLIQWYVLLFFIFPLLVLLVSWMFQKKFSLWAFDDVLFIKKGILGEERILMLWHKVQAVSLQQSIYQRRKDLASLLISTAGGTITVNFIELQAARALADFILYKTESSNKEWM